MTDWLHFFASERIFGEETVAETLEVRPKCLTHRRWPRLRFKTCTMAGVVAIETWPPLEKEIIRTTRKRAPAKGIMFVASKPAQSIVYYDVGLFFLDTNTNFDITQAKKQIPEQTTLPMRGFAAASLVLVLT